MTEGIEKERIVKMPKRIRIWFYAITCTLVPLTTYAQVEDEYPEWIVWSGGVGVKKYTICNTSGYFVNGIQNFDHGNNNQSAYMTCSKIDSYLPTENTDHDKCIQQQVEWFGGVGDKPWSNCPDGKYAVGFQIEDYGKNNQAIMSMRCCGVVGITTVHGNSYTTVVEWSGGPGPKTPSKCKTGYYVTGIHNKDWGNNNQSIGQMKCTQPVLAGQGLQP